MSLPSGSTHTPLRPPHYQRHHPQHQLRGQPEHDRSVVETQPRLVRLHRWSADLGIGPASADGDTVGCRLSRPASRRSRSWRKRPKAVSECRHWRRFPPCLASRSFTSSSSTEARSAVKPARSDKISTTEIALASSRATSLRASSTVLRVTKPRWIARASKNRVRALARHGFDPLSHRERRPGQRGDQAAPRSSEWSGRHQSYHGCRAGSKGQQESNHDAQRGRHLACKSRGNRTWNGLSVPDFARLDRAGTVLLSVAIADGNLPF